MIAFALQWNVMRLTCMFACRCHVFPLLCPFIPEGQESFEFMCDWIRAR